MAQLASARLSENIIQQEIILSSLNSRTALLDRKPKSNGHREKTVIVKLCIFCPTNLETNYWPVCSFF